MNGVGDLDRCTVSMDLGASQELNGVGFVEQAKVTRVCTSKKLITTAIGSGPLYDITLDEIIEDEHKKFFDERPVEAVIEYERKLEKPEINRALLGGEQFAFSPSLNEPNYGKFDIEVPSLFIDNPESHAKSDFCRVLKSKLSGDGSTLAILADRVDTGVDGFKNTQLYIYKRNGEQWNTHSTIVVDETSLSEISNENQFYGNKYLDSNLAINKNGDFIAVSFLDRGDNSDLLGRAHLYKLGFSTNDEYDLCALSAFLGGFEYLGVDLSLSDDGTILAASSRTWSGSAFPRFQGNVRVLKFTETSSTEPAANFQQLGSTLTSNIFGQYFRVNAFGEKIAINGNGDRLAVLRIDTSTGIQSENTKAFVNIYEYQSDAWVLVQQLENDKFLFDPGEEAYFGNDGGTGYRQEDSTSGFDLAISQDGKAVAFGAIDPFPDSFNDARGGAVITWRETSTNVWKTLTVIKPDYTRERDDAGSFDAVGLGGNLSFSSDGKKLMISQDKSVCVYEDISESPVSSPLPQPGYFVVGSADSDDWVKVSQIDIFNCPPITRNDKIKRPFNAYHPITDASMSQDGSYVVILKNNFIHPTQDGFLVQPDQASQQAVYKVDYTKAVNKFDRDLLSNYIDWKDGSISCKDLKFQSELEIDTDSLRDYRCIDSPYNADFKQSEIFQSDANIEVSDNMSVSFFLNGPTSNLYSSDPVIKIYNSNGSMSVGLDNLNNSQDRLFLSFNQFGSSSIGFLRSSEDPAHYDSDQFGGLYEIKADNNYESDWHHYCITSESHPSDPDLNIIKGYVDGRFIDQITIENIPDNSNLFGCKLSLDSPRTALDPYDGEERQDFNGNLTPAYDDIRVYNKTLSQNEINLLASHRVKVTRRDIYFYDYLKEENGVISLEYNRSTYKDVPISSFCKDQPIPAPPDFAGCDFGTECVIDAEIKFCYDSTLPNIVPIFGLYASGISGVGFLESNSPPHIQLVSYHQKNLLGRGIIFDGGLMAHSLNLKMSGVSDLSTGFVDKYNGSFFDLSAVQKLYPSSDISNVGFVSSDGDFDLFNKIDEGVYEGDWQIDSTRISDDSESYVQLIAPDTKGSFSYECGITNTLFDPEESLIRFRLSGPTSTSDCALPPRYTIKNIKLKDPQGTLITQYEDIVFIGDSDFDNDINYTSVVRSEKINKVKGFYRWQDTYPTLDSGNAPHGFSLSFDIDAEDLGAEFTLGYSKAFKEDTTQLSSPSINNSLRISAIEILTSGRASNYQEHYINLMTPVVDTGRRIEKCFHPTFFPKFDFDTGIWPSVSSIWYANNDVDYSNQSTQGSLQLLENIRDPEDDTFAILNSMGDIENSGKLTLKFGYSPSSQKEIQAGSFSDAFGEGRNKRDNIWFSPSGAFSGLTTSTTDIDHNFFKFDSITLKVRAKKAVGSRDYVLDVVGYSDDCLLNVTSAVGGFLQNTSGVTFPDHSDDSLVFYGNTGSIPTTSGFKNVDDLGLSTEPFSNKDHYFESNSTNNAGGDHYLLTTYPTVTSTEFEWYEIPLKAYEDNVEIGRSKQYNLSSLLERLYLDIYPLPTGAAISNIHLCVRYAPQNAFNLTSQGGEKIGRIADGRTEGSYFPTSRQSNDLIINAGSGFNPLSYISGIPQAFTTPDSLKSNYSRRWRGMEGTVQGPYDVDQFGFGFENPHLDYPFISGFYLFEDNSTAIRPVVGALTGTLTTSYDNFQFTNIGWRFSNSGLFTDRWPTYSTPYTTTDWTALEDGSNNFQNHELYGQVADAFRNVVRISGQNSFINFGNINYGPQGDLGLSVYIRFTPDANVSGANYNLFNSGVLVSKYDAGQDIEFCLGYSDGYLVAKAKDATSGSIKQAIDTVKYSGYQYPLSVIMTYNDDNSHKLKLYTDNEFESNWTTLRATSDSFYMDVNSSDLRVGHSPGSGVGFNMFLSEFGLSSGNIVQSTPDATHKEVTAQKFFENNRVYWWDEGETTSEDAYKLWDYVNENTYTDWHIGAFKHCEFNYEFDNLGSRPGKRTGRDLINFNIKHHGSGYIQYASLAMPSNVDSGVSYHTQIENDFLRLHLSDTPDNFYAVYPRVSKNLPHGYKFTEKALVVETVLEHKSDSHNIVWEDGSIGPKLIVSLYTKNQEPEHPLVEPFTEPNWGLVNRAIHYLPPSSCLMRFDSTFNYNDYCDESEKWALFPHEPRLTELTEKYFSKDVDDMFLQYDLVYPSGPAFDSRIDMHTCHVRAEDAFVNATNTSGVFNLYTSGNPSPVTGVLDMFTFNASGMGPEFGWSPASGLNMILRAPIEVNESGFILYASGEQISAESLKTFIDGHELIKESGFNLIASGDGRTWTSFPPRGGAVVGSDFVVGDAPTIPPLPMLVFGKGVDSGVLPLSIGAIKSPTSPEASLPLSLFPSTAGSGGVRDFMPVYLLQNFSNEPGPKSGELELSIIGAAGLSSRYRNASTNLSLRGPDRLPLKENVNLTLYGDNLSEVVSTGSLNLFSSNYTGFNTPFYLWYNNNYGTGITLEDNNIASILVGDEIRGVTLFGYGSCTGDSPQKAIDPAIITDDTVWREETCNEGGIFRATKTYTNLSAGYSGNYYGIRKLQGLIPDAPYMTTLKIRTGSTTAIPVPRDWEEWEYGTCGPDTIGGCCPDDACSRNINFSGIKLIGDYPYLSGDATHYDVSGRLAGDNYGHAVAVKKDLMAVGAPKHNIYDERGELLNDAGAVFLYRRNEDVAGLKADWELEEKVLLPSGYRQDHISATYQNLLCYPNNITKEFCISGQQWNIGQEGREFGYSLDLASSGDKETLVVGAPGAYWDRTFEDIVVSGIPVLMLVFTDKFSYNKEKIAAIGNTALKYDILYKYFAVPWDIGGSDFQPQLDINVLLCQIHDSDQKDSLPKVRSDKPWFHHLYINNLLDGNEDSTVLKNTAVSGIQKKFFEMFPYSNNLYSGIPPIVGVFGDDTPSTFNKGAFQPALDEFLSFYQDYAYQSGIKDLTNDTEQSGYIKQIYSDSFNWDKASVEILNETLATGNLLTQKQVQFPDYNSAGNVVMNYITSGVGQQYARSNSYEFQIPPESGGRVYIFEKESGNFNLVQEIVSPQEDLKMFDSDDFAGAMDENGLPYGVKPNDRFGHAVSISNNSEVVTVGSPYSSEACLIYERDEKENARMYKGIRSWLDFNSLVAESTRYDTLLAASGDLEVQKTIYHELTKGNKFLLRSDKNFWGKTPINLYKKIFKYDYSDIPYTGTWGFIPQEVAGTSRLGYSTAVGEDGDIVAFGAPTDSFNEFDDYNVYYRSEDTWASYMQAGAVRVFESRKYYPHSGAVEFTRFGNLDRSVHGSGDNQQFYDQMGLYFKPDNVSFERLPFSEIEIPQSAGLAFIITPEIDAASDEIIDNIKSWLALGDRTLVLVGNDPIWEDDGLYFDSNEIVNKVLQKLGSRMRLVPARNEYESLVGGVAESDYNNDKYNVTKAFIPDYIHDTHLTNNNMFASGVADIRIDISDLELEDLLLHSPCDKINTRCEHTIQHMGDLRAQWNSECIVAGTPPGKIEFKTNWPFHFNNENPARDCSFWPQNPKPYIDRPGEAIRPVLTAAEHITPPPRIIAASSGEKEQCTTSLSGIIKTEYTTSTKLYEFADTQIDELAFSISQPSGTLLSGIFDDFTRGQFFDPAPFDKRNSFMQAAGTSYEIDVPPDDVVVSPESVWATEESYLNNTVDTGSKVILFASMLSETDWALGKSNNAGEDPNNKDQNIFFYNNLVALDCNSAGNIIQLGGWTGRNSFKSAFSDSAIAKTFIQGGHTVSSGVLFTDNDPISTIHNVAWVADPVAKPSDEDITRLKNWLNTGNKKLVMTYSANQEKANIIEYICDQLELNTKPFYSKANGAYFVQDTELVAQGNTQGIPYDSQGGIEQAQLIDETASVFVGCDKGYAFNAITAETKVEKLAIIPKDANQQDYSSEVDFETGFTEYAFIPIKPGANTKKLVRYKAPLIEKRFNNPYIYWKIDGDANADFKVIAGSGYRLYINYISESPDEKFDINLGFDGVSFSPYPDDREESGDGNVDDDSRKLDRTDTYKIKTKVFDIKAKDTSTEFSLKFDTDEWRQIKSADFDGNRPLTPRVVSISGCPLPIEVETLTSTRIKERKIYVTRCSGVPFFNPEQRIEFDPVFRPISTLNDKYCQSSPACDGYGGQMIQDGPIIAADELEHFTTFNAGRNRSRIVVLSDSTLIQGQSPYFRNDALEENQKFIRSLYPTSPEKYGNMEYSNDTNFIDGVRKFSFTQKILSPQRGSAAKYYAASGLTNLVDRYTLGGSLGNLTKYTDQESSKNPGDIFREFSPETPEKLEQELEKFGEDIIPIYGVYPRYSGIIDGKLYLDAGIEGGMPQFMIDKHKDYIDFDMLASGYAGDLFGISIDIHNDKLIVGAPFNGFLDEDIRSWPELTNLHASGFVGSGLKLSGNGGAGAAFYYERTGRGKNSVSEFLPWQFQQKIKPSSINVGIDNATLAKLKEQKAHRPIDITSDFVAKNAMITDRFGYSVSIDSDFAAIGAPAHDFETTHQHIYGGSAAFIRKEFGGEFDIPEHKFFDLGSSGVRIDDFNRASGKMVLNNGAVFTYRHKMTDWAARSKEWVYAQKMYPEGFSDRNTVALTGCENDFFGFSVAIDRARRGDSDYVMVAGSPNHNYPTSGQHTTQELEDAGSSYTFDAMLREQLASLPNAASYIDAQVFGHKPESQADRLRNIVYQNTTGGQETFEVSGIIIANENGDVFLEVSGQDPATKGFVAHRPYVELVRGELISGTGVNQEFNLITDGQPVPRSGFMNLSIPGPSSDIVYNNMNLYSFGAYVGSGDMPLYMQVASGTSNNSLDLLLKDPQIIANMNLRIRGK